MAVLRLFAQAREAAGVSTMQVDGATVHDVLQNASSTLGSAFIEVLSMSKVWLNGEEVPLHTVVSDKDEVAVLPPVSGGMR